MIISLIVYSVGFFFSVGVNFLEFFYNSSSGDTPERV